MNIEKKLIELNKEKQVIEQNVANIQKEMATLQQQLASLNRDYLVLLGEIKAYEEIKKEE